MVRNRVDVRVYVFPEHSLGFFLSVTAPGKQDLLSTVLAGGFCRFSPPLIL